MTKNNNKKKTISLQERDALAREYNIFGDIVMLPGIRDEYEYLSDKVRETVLAPE